jgi:hypothetical protein
MGFKDSSWFRGGIILSVGMIFFVIIGLILEKVFGLNVEFMRWFLILFIFPLLPLYFSFEEIFTLSENIGPIMGIFLFIVLIIYSFLVGAFIGWIFGKIMSRKESISYNRE